MTSETPKKKKSVLRRILKWTGITFLVLIIFLIAAPFLFKKQIVQFVKDTANEQLNAKVNFGEFDLTLISSFPDFTLSVDSLSVANVGDFEGDTLQGRDRRVRIVTFVDRKTGYLIAFLLPKMNVELLTSLSLKYFQKIPKKKRKTVTLDNGPEFSDWERFGKKLHMTVYFAYPYHFWERGTNENTNGLLRQYFPSSMDFNLITQQQLSYVVRRLNNRERKRLKFKTPKSIFLSH